MKDKIIYFLVIIFLFTRLINLTLMPVFVDEAIYIHWSQMMWDGQRLRFLSLTDGKQPFFMLLTIPLLFFFQDPLIAGRMVSVLAGLASLFGIYLFCKEFLSNRTAVLSSILYITAPFTLFYDRLAVVDGLLTAFGIWSLYISVKLFKTREKFYALPLGLIFGSALWTKTPGTFFIILSFLTPLISWEEKIKKKYWAYSLFSAVLGFGIYNLLRASKGFWLIAKRNADYVYSFPELINRGLLNPLIPNFTSSLSWIFSYLTPLLAITSFAATGYILLKKNKIGLVLFLWFIIPILGGAFISKAYTARYILISIPYLLIISAIMLEKLNKIILLRSNKLALFIILIPAVLFDYYLLTNIEKAPIPHRERSGYLEEWSSGYGIKEVSDYLINKSNELGGSKIYVMTEGYVGTLPDGINIYTYKYKNIESFGIGWPVGSFPPNLNDYLSRGKVYLVVNQSRMKLPSTDNLKLINKYPKPFSINNQDFLLFYEVIPK